jgi:hypothetical protein
MEQRLESLLNMIKGNYVASKGKYCVKFKDPHIFEESGGEEPIFEFYKLYHDDDIV